MLCACANLPHCVVFNSFSSAPPHLSRSGLLLPHVTLIPTRHTQHKQQTEQTVERLLAAIQLGNASLALAAAEKMNGRLPEAEAALRHGVAQLRWVLGVGAADLQRLNASALEVRGGKMLGGL